MTNVFDGLMNKAQMDSISAQFSKRFNANKVKAVFDMQTGKLYLTAPDFNGDAKPATAEIAGQFFSQYIEEAQRLAAKNAGTDGDIEGHAV